MSETSPVVRQRLELGTARLVDSVLRADSIAKVDDAVFTLGDNVYTSGTTAAVQRMLHADVGRSEEAHHQEPSSDAREPRVLHADADPYYKYFGPAAGVVGKGYYSYDVGNWHVVVVNSEIIVNSSFSDSARNAQMDWVEKDLKAHKKLCTIAYWHNPRFSSGWHGSDRKSLRSGRSCTTTTSISFSTVTITTTSGFVR